MTEKQIIFNAGFDAGYNAGSRRMEDPKIKQDTFDRFQEGTMGSGREILSFNDISVDFAEGRYLLAAIASITGYASKFEGMVPEEVMAALRDDVAVMFESKSAPLVDFDAWLNATTIEVKKVFPSHTPNSRLFRESYFDKGASPDAAADHYISTQTFNPI